MEELCSKYNLIFRPVLKIGDILIVREDLSKHEIYNKCYVFVSMERYRGKQVEVLEIFPVALVSRRDSIRILIKGSIRQWSLDMFKERIEAVMIARNVIMSVKEGD